MLGGGSSCPSFCESLARDPLEFLRYISILGEVMSKILELGGWPFGERLAGSNNSGVTALQGLVLRFANEPRVLIFVWELTLDGAR